MKQARCKRLHIEWFISMKYPVKRQIYRQRQSAIILVWGFEKGFNANRHKGTFWGNEDVLRLAVVMITQSYDNPKLSITLLISIKLKKEKLTSPVRNKWMWCVSRERHRITYYFSRQKYLYNFTLIMRKHQRISNWGS